MERLTLPLMGYESQQLADVQSGTHPTEMILYSKKQTYPSSTTTLPHLLETFRSLRGAYRFCHQRAMEKLIGQCYT